MQLELNREDLRPEYYLREAAKVDFRHFTKEAMEKIVAAGGAMFKYGPGCYTEIKIKLPQSRVKPIKPEDVKAAPIPNEVIQVFNALIQSRWDGKKARIEQDEVLLAICLAMGISKGEVFNKKLLDVEEVFRRAGWKVTYDKPSLAESFPAFFVFSAKNTEKE